MHRERKIPPDNTQTRAVILLEFTNYLSRGGAGWTLEVAEFLQCNRRAGLAANMQRLPPNFAGRWSRYAATCDSALFRAIEHRTGADRQRRHRGDDDKRKRALHGKITVGLIGGNCLQVFLSNPRTHRKQSVRVKRDATRLDFTAAADAFSKRPVNKSSLRRGRRNQHVRRPRTGGDRRSSPTQLPPTPAARAWSARARS